MRTKLLMLLIFTGCLFANAQWSQVGSPQFTNFTDNVALSFHPINGRPYVVYNDVTDGNKPKVMRYDGTTWVAVGGTISNMASANHAIKFNPVTNEPWVAYRRTADDQMDVYSFDGVSWVARGVNLNYGFTDNPFQIQFNSSGDVRVAGKITSKKLRIIQFPGGTLSGSALEEVLINSPQYVLDHNYDYVNYNDYFVAYAGTDNSSVVGRKPVGSSSNVASFDMYAYIGGRTLRNISGINNKTLAAAYRVNGSIEEILIFQNTSLVSYYNTTKNVVKFRENLTNNKNYLMYSDVSENLSFSIINDNGTISSSLPTPGVSTSSASFFAEMEMNPTTGSMFIAYMDSGKLSVQEFTPAPTLSRIYVNANAAGGNGNGDSWANATTDLQTAIQSAGTTTSEIWVASGTYKPGSGRTDSFDIDIDGLHIYGGFNGTESSISERDILANPTILSGDLNDNDLGHGTGTRGDNSYHVMQVLNADNAVIDGFKIMYGHANGSGTNGYGGAINIGGQTSNLKIYNCEFDENFGLAGGAVRSYLNNDTSMTFQNCIFNDNLSRYGSGLYFLVNQNRTVTLDMVNCLFTNNTSYNVSGSALGYTGSSAWIRANDSGSNLTTTITNCTFANNEDIGTYSSSLKGTLALSRRLDGNSTHNATINNSVFYFNDQGASGGVGLSVNPGHVSYPNTVFVNNSISEDNFNNLSFLTNTSNADPLFTDVSNNDFTLQSGSPAIDAGDNNLVPSGITADLLFNQRIHNATVDMGVYEFGANPTLSNEDFSFSTDSIEVYPNPTTSIINIKTTSKIKSVEVYNVLGTKVRASILASVDLSGLSNGFYLVKINTETGSITKRIIKK